MGLRHTSFSIHHGLSIFHLFIFLLLLGVSAMSQQNVTVDDTNSAIVYAPPGAWTLSANSSLDIGGAHMLTQSPNGTATFKFTGTAIYFLSPKWPYLVNTAVSLDNGPVTLVDLVDRSRPDAGQGPETVQSAVVWSATGLNNTSHTLVMSVGAGQPYGVVDALIYTTLLSNTTLPIASSTAVSSSAAVSSSSSPSSSSSSATTPSTTPSDPTAVVTAPPSADATASGIVGANAKKAPVAQIAIGTLFGFILLLALVFYLIHYLKRRNRPKSEAWTVSDADGSQGASAAYPFTNRHSRMHGTSMRVAGGASAASLVTSTPRNGGTLQHGPAPAYYDHSTAAGDEEDDFDGGHVVSDTPATAGHTPASAIAARYRPGDALSTITERSTPRTGEGRLGLPGSPDLHYAAAPALSANDAENGAASRSPPRWI